MDISDAADRSVMQDAHGCRCGMSMGEPGQALFGSLNEHAFSEYFSIDDVEQSR
jgi:hypothetical protein